MSGHTTWAIQFGRQTEGEYFCFVRDEQGQPVDTFYGDAPTVFSEVASLLESQATGRGFGAVPEPIRTETTGSEL